MSAAVDACPLLVVSGLEQQQRTMVMQLWHDTARIKGKAVTDYIKELLMNSSTDDKFLIFAYHRLVDRTG